MPSTYYLYNNKRIIDIDMGKYLKKFITHSDYETYISGKGKVLPNVSYCYNDKETHYNPLRKNVITYKASSKLTETTSQKTAGLHTNAFNTTIVNHTFENGVGTITFAGDVTNVGSYAFYNCSGITEIEMPIGVTNVSDYAFYQCSNLDDVVIPDNVTSIGNYAFQNCTSLEEVTIPDSVTSIGSSAFSGCGSLPVENNLRYADTYLVGAVDNTKTTYTIKDGTRFIGTYAFQNCTGLTSIGPVGSGSDLEIPDSVTSIGSNAFQGCTGLTSVDIPDSVTEIGGYAFNNCNRLTSVDIPDSVTSIGSYAFQGCTSLEEVTIGSGVTSIGNQYRFNKCGYTR